MVLDFKQAGGKVVSPTKLAHIVLRTNNRVQLKDFYLTFLGGKEQFSNDAMSFLTYDEEHHRIAIVQIPGVGPKVRKSCGMEHVAFTYASLSELLLAYRQRKALGIKPIWTVNHGPTVSFYYKDPDGNIIETQVDSMTPDEANEFLASEEMEVNPIGIDIDPEDFIRRLEHGELESVLHQRPKGVSRTEIPQQML